MRLERWKTLWPEIEPLLDDLLDLDEPERARALERITESSPETGRALASLLSADRVPDGPLERPVLGAERPMPADPAIGPGTRFGPYVVRREIGRGGMGTVLLAERDDGQFEQRVAVKRVRSDALTPGAGERFLAERRILARLQHANIAHLLDGGFAADGTPYLVMEYVEGRPITAWCDQRRLGVRARIHLFRQVCAAVESAHAQLVVHRDLKPDNILVTEGGEVKLLDFGIAKLLDPAAAVLHTGTQVRVFTPAYATPEQYLGDPPTAVTDEYQLALVLHELLTGRRLHEETVTSPLAHQRRVLEQDPERPSRRVTRAVTDAAGGDGIAARESLAALRGTTVDGLSRALAGDLDAILLKALERQPADRYVSVEAFRRDLENVLADRPVSARRATAAYRARKFTRRHRVALAAAALVVVALGAGLLVAWTQARVAARERDLARAAERKATAINDFVLRELLEAPTPERALGRPLTVAEVLGSASRTVSHAFAGQPATEAEVRMTLARSYQALGRLDEAQAHAQAALRLLHTPGAGDLRARFEARALLADIALDQGRARETRPEIESLLADQTRALGAGDPATLATSELLGRALSGEGRFEAADSTLRAAAALAGDEPANWRLPVDLDRALADVWVSQGRAREADSLLLRTLAIERRHLGTDHPLIAATLRQRAGALTKDLRPAEAIAVLREVLAVSTRVNGANHPATGQAWMALAVGLDSRLDHIQALDATRHAVDIFRSTLGDDHPLTLKAMRNLAILLHGQQRYAAAESVYREVWRTCARTLGPDHAQTLEALQGLVYLLLDQGRTAEAVTYARQIGAAYARVAARPDADPVALTTYAEYLVEAQPPEVRDPVRAVTVARRAVAATHHEDYVSLRALGFAEDAAGDPRAAITALNEALALPEGVRSWTTEDKLVDVLRRHGAPGELERTLLARIDVQRRVRGPDDRHIAKTERHLARLYHDAGRDSLAEHWERESLAQLRKTLPETHWEIGRAKAELGSLRLAAGDFAEAETLLVQGTRTLEADPEVPLSDLETTRADLVRLYRTTGRPAAARAWHDHVFAARTPGGN